MDTKYKFISTTLPYINSKPHIGHALEFIQADVLARHYRIKGRDVHFNVGVDEHGEKVYKAAGDNVRDYVDKYAALWDDFCTKFNILYTRFYRTSDPFHYELVKQFWEECLKRGDLEKRSYTGKYCVGCESFKTDTELVDGHCQDHRNTVINEVTESNWFFKLSKYKEQIRKHVVENPEFLTPQYKINELLNLIDGSDDISVSRLRTSVPWGIPVPNDDEQNIYVWFEALLNYVFSAGYQQDNHKFNSMWADSLQLCGPDNLRFQAIILQGLLASAGIPFTKRLLVHGTVTDSDGRKMSKSEGNVVDPYEQIEKYGLDAVRFYAIAGLNTCENGAWSESDLVKLYNSSLADVYGNLVNRVLHLIESKNVTIGLVDNDFSNCVEPFLAQERDAWDALNLKTVCQVGIDLLKFGNIYITEQAPWKQEDPSQVLTNLHYLLLRASGILLPVIPDAAGRAGFAIIDQKKVILFPRMEQPKSSGT